MLVLGIETTCDETGIAIVEDGKKILSNVVATQADLHAKFGGVFPEEACRRHVETLSPILQESLQEAQRHLKDIGLIAIAYGPGLIGALLIGVHFAKGLSLGLDIPIIGVNHVEAHLYSAWMSHKEKIPLPALGLVLSGGHTTLLKINAISDYELLGQTQDDACGEAFDKVATILDLPYPGGPQIETLAQRGDPHRFSLKAGTIKGRPYDFSFSGLKTGVLYLVKGQDGSKKSPLKISESDKKDVAASFQRAAFLDIVTKAKKAAASFKAKSLIIGGGVSQNQNLRLTFSEHFMDTLLFWPQKGLILDNGAMIAGLGYVNYLTKGSSDLCCLFPKPRIPF